jgi:hypothetical protein
VDDAAAASTVRGSPNKAHTSDQVNGAGRRVVSDVDAAGRSLQDPLRGEEHAGEEPAVYQPYRNVSNLDAMGMISSRASLEPAQTDLQAQYVGPSSGVGFLRRVQKRLHETISFTHSSSIFAFGDAPLPDFDPTFFFMPPKADAEELVARYFDFAVPTHRFLHRPTIETWLDEFYETKGAMRNEGDALGRSASLLMVFAQATDYMPNSDAQDNSDVRHVDAPRPSL